jgi:hypothetical protein
MAAIGAVTTVVGAAIAASTYPGHWGVTWLAAVLGLAMLVVIALPELSPSMKLPGRKGGLMIVVGGVAAILMAFVFLTTIGFTFEFFDIQSFLFLVAVAGALLMGWAGWQAFQTEGGAFKAGIAAGSPPAAMPLVPPPAAAPPSSAQTAPTAPTPRSGESLTGEEHDR